MVSLLLTLLVCTLVAFKFVALGALVLAGLGLWVVLRLGFRILDRVSALAFGRRPPPARVVWQARPVETRYREEKRPAAAPAVACHPQPVRSSRCGRRSGASWSFWAVGLLVFAAVALGFRANGRVFLDSPRASGQSQAETVV